MRTVMRAALAAAVACGGALVRADDARPANKGAVPEAPREDPRAEFYRRATVRVSAAEEGLKAATDDFAAAVAKFDPKAADALDLTAEAGLKACGQLEAAFREAGKRAKAYQEAVTALRAETAAAPAVYRQMAVYHRELAEKAKTPAFKAGYLESAGAAERLADVMEGRVKELDALAAGGAAGVKPAKDEVDVVVFLAEGEQYFRHMGDFFRGVPGAASAAERKRFRDQLKELAERTDSFMRAYKAFSDKLKAAPVSPKLKAEGERDRAAARERERDRELGKAKALLAEADGLLAERAKQWAVLEPALKGMVESGQQAAAQRAAANFEASWRREWQRYALPPVTLAGGRAAATHAALVPAEHYPVVRGGAAAGFAKVLRRLPAGGVEVEAVVGELRPGDTLLVKVA
jgi:hypothetical protein